MMLYALRARHRSEILKKKKNFGPTYPKILGHVTGNTHTFLFGLTAACRPC